MEFQNHSKMYFNRRLVYFLVFLFVAVPVVVGVLVWHFTNESCPSPDIAGGVTDGLGEDRTTTTKPSSMTTTSSLPTVSESEPWKNLRLSRKAMPVHYDITLYPDFYGDHGWFYGNETVEIGIHGDTRFILIHMHLMNITNTELRDNSTDEIISIKQPWEYEQNEFWVIETQGDPLRAGTGVKLSLQFDGSLTRAIVGFYKSTYVNSITNQTRHLATSKFEPVAARRAFPCFDEPNIKAEYTVSLVHQPEYIALSNMPAQTPVDWPVDSTLTVTHFNRSVKMSTYLVCFIVCDFKYLETTTKYGTKLRVYATPDRVNQSDYSMQIAKTSMELYQDLFNVEFPLPKQDMIAIPDFVSGAMEHWGLITYRETNMLYDENEASSSNKQRVAVVVAHEVSHQWFGNIVTMDWWDDLWLNEGFASFMEYLGADEHEPQWDMLEQFVTEDNQPVMITDAGVSSHPIIVHVEEPSQINAVFDSISYSKGSAIIRMLEVIMGKDRFFKGVELYLRNHVWANAKTDDLWNALGEISPGISVKDVMDTWTIQMGFPYINITFEGTEIVASQARFLADSSTTYDENDSPFKYRWYVSLDYISSNSTGRKQQWLTKDQDTVSFQSPIDPGSTDTWVKFNLNQTGYYRVNYPEYMWKRFASLLQRGSLQSTLTPVDRSGLINDAFNLARGGYLRYDVALELTMYLDTENDHLPWESTYDAFKYIKSMFEFGGQFGLWRVYVLQKAKPVLDRIGWADEGSHLEKLMRTNLISLACGMGDRECLNNATERFLNWINNGVKVPPNLRSLVYKYGMESAESTQIWDKMWQKYVVETVPQERVKLLYGLAQTRSVWLLARYLDYAMDESKVRSQDFFTVVAYIDANPVGRSMVWDWARQNWQMLVDRFTLYSRYFGRMIPSIISNFNTEFQLQEVEEFFAKYPEAGAGETGRKQALESIRRNIEWMRKYDTVITRWLKTRT